MSSWKDNVRKVEPYVPGEQPKIKNVIKLNTNENPYPPSPKVQKIIDGFDVQQLRLYPDPEVAELIAAIAKNKGLDKEQVFVGVGSDDVLAMSFLTFFGSEQPILFPDITYSFYDVWAELFRIPYEQIPLQEDFRICVDDYKRKNGGIVIPNPNAPTGILMPLSEIEDIIQHNRNVIVVVDEAYIDFGGESALPLIEKYDNLLVVQTFSKSRSMAGMRIGYAMGNEKLIKYLNDAKYSFNSYTMNQAALVCGAEAVKDKAYFEETIQKIVETRTWSVKQFEELGFKCLDSQANFIFVTHPEYDAKEMFEALKKEDIYVRFWGSERIEQYMRVTVGTREEMEALFAFLRRYIKGE